MFSFYSLHYPKYPFAIAHKWTLNMSSSKLFSSPNSNKVLFQLESFFNCNSINPFNLQSSLVAHSIIIEVSSHPYITIVPYMNTFERKIFLFSELIDEMKKNFCFELNLILAWVVSYRTRKYTKFIIIWLMHVNNIFMRAIG